MDCFYDGTKVHKSNIKSTLESSLFSRKTTQFTFPFPAFILRTRTQKKPRAILMIVIEDGIFTNMKEESVSRWIVKDTL